ncbi:MAG: M28 family peptidase, partial [Candidatus Eremiobacteraeota bacterium]|nr:M28 family peptidase [Candidatus Eremiobacteraeota bacterium]
NRNFINVLGVIRGEEEPHRFVLISNHHDAWTYGGVDPGTGTATMLELARIFGRLHRIGWKPRRSLIFGFWDGEEYALTGSTAWGEEESGRMRECLACLNVDAAVSGNKFSCASSPLLVGLINQIASKVRLPGGKWMGSFFKHPCPDDEKSDGSGALPGCEPIEILAGGTDHTVFFNRMGVPSLNVCFEGPYGVYHSMYDDFEWVKKFADPNFLYHTAMAKFIGLMALHLMESDILPYDVLAYPRAFRGHLDTLPRKSKIMEILQKAADKWDEAAREAHSAIISVKQRPPGAVREKTKIINDALLSIERSLLDKDGLTGREWFRHLIYVPQNTYRAQVFPGIMAALEKGKRKDAIEQAKKIAAAVEKVCMYLKRITKAIK